MLDAIFNLLKVSAVIFIATVFGVAIFNLLNLIQSIVFGNVIGEVFSLVSMYLPFNAFNVFGGIGRAISGIFSFMIAKKIFDLTSWSISSI